MNKAITKAKPKRTRKPGGGRPKLPEDYRRDRVVRVRLTENELKEFEEGTRYLLGSTSEQIRNMIFHEPFRVQFASEDLDSLAGQLYQLRYDFALLSRSKKTTLVELRTKFTEMIETVKNVEIELKQRLTYEVMLKTLTQLAKNQ
ncbi:hypothetical protein BWI93_25900 [Siphonobacter sp. BAB-5385]|uniref:hypothetical protein n=1 Tax=Siphonobacter sp. BAB-5385 TaxID=1864822 RepID=UPI000B9EC438|nr:hypothetical protein [Siphonobacter sp. BAB-5385]OZI05345.1 hypothetical protein BWI93_25900 [Siphonobacter sp. BAB-5385]